MITSPTASSRKLNPALIGTLGLALSVATANALALDTRQLAAACASSAPTLEDDFRCGLAHYLGKGAEHDDAEAYRRFSRAALGGHVEALNNLGQMLLDRDSPFRDDRKGFALLLQAAERGYAKAQYSAALLFEEGRGTRQNFVVARHWYRKAADQGHSFAQNNLGNLLRYGVGGPRDPVEAAHLYRLAAEQANPSAAFNLAELYLEGNGVAEDRVEAHLWFTRAAAWVDNALKARIFDVLTALEQRLTETERKAVADQEARWRTERPAQDR